MFYYLCTQIFSNVKPRACCYEYAWIGIKIKIQAFIPIIQIQGGLQDMSTS